LLLANINIKLNYQKKACLPLSRFIFAKSYKQFASYYVDFVKIIDF